MSNEIEYIEDYFEKNLNDAESRLFEERCARDKDFADQVAFYIASRAAIRQELLAQKQKEWLEDERSSEKALPTVGLRPMKTRFRKWLPYSAAACVLVAFVLYFILDFQTPHQYASNFIERNYTVLSQNMDASLDSVQQGIEAYNRKDYQKALLLFETYYQSHPDNGDLKKYIGIVYLMKKDYDNALVHFEELAKKKKLYNNPGMFLTALTLLERRGNNDKENAKKYLEIIVRDNLDYSTEAKELLKKW